MFLKHIPTILLLAVVWILSDFVVRADDPPQVQETKTITGTITVLQKATKQLVLKTNEGKDVILNLDGQTSVKLENENLNWFELKEGMMASVTYVNPPKASQFLVRTIIASKPDPNVIAEKPKGTGSPDNVEPITVKGKIDYVKSDLSEITIKTFGDKLIILQVDDDWRNRLKNGVTTVPSLAKGTEVGAIYIVQDGKNKLVVLRDIFNTEPSSGQTINPIPPSASTPRMINNQQNVNNSQTLVVGQTNGLPLVNMPLPAGFAALSNQLSGALVGDIVQMKKDAAILTSGTASAPPVPSVPSNGSVSNPPQRSLSNPSRTAPVARDYFVMLVNGSKEPLLVDQQTTITIGNRKASLQELVDGTKMFVNFEVLADGTRHVVTIRASNNQLAKSDDIVQAGQQDNRNPPTQQNPIEQNKNANPSFQANAISAQVLRGRAGIVFAQSTQNEILVLMAINSSEPLRIDDRTRFTVNNREARFTDLQVGMRAQVFLETYNQMRRVIGVVASQEGVPSQPHNGDGGLSGDKK